MGQLDHSLNKTEAMNAKPSPAKVRAIVFLALSVLPLALSLQSMRPLLKLISESDTFSQVPIIPLVTCFLIYMKKNEIFADLSTDWKLGAPLFGSGLSCLFFARFNVWHLRLTNPYSLLIFAVVLMWLGAFALCFGARSFRAACFPLLFLFFTVPIPEPLLSTIISFLQTQSSNMAELFFRLTGIPFHREGFVFELPGVTIQVAEECSGIHSTLALLTTTVLASYIFLASPGKRFILWLAVVPTAIFKNGLRIATLSLLSVYVDPRFLYGKLHTRGGIVFFVLALLPMALLLSVLQKLEAGHTAARTGASPQISTT